MEKKDRLARAAKYLTNSRYVGTWNRWKDMVAEQIDLREKLEKASKYFLNQAYVASWNAWRSMFEEALQQRRTPPRGLLGWPASEPWLGNHAGARPQVGQSTANRRQGHD